MRCTASLLVMGWSLGIGAAGLAAADRLDQPPAAATEKIADTPDLTQTDKEAGFPAGGSTFCGPTAVSNSIIWLGRHGHPRLIPQAASPKQSQIALAKLLGSPRYLGNSDQGVGPYRLCRGVTRYVLDQGCPTGQVACRGWRPHPSEFSADVNIPQIRWLQAAIQGTSAVWLNLGWYKYSPDRDEYERFAGHWVTMVGYGVDSNGKPDDSIIIIHDPAPRAGPAGKANYVSLQPIASGRLVGKTKGLPRPAKGLYKMTGGMRIKRGADCAILDLGVALRLPQSPQVSKPSEGRTRPRRHKAPRRLLQAKPRTREETASAKLRLATLLIKATPQRAGQRLQEIVDKLPHTKAADRARQLLAELP